MYSSSSYSLEAKQIRTASLEKFISRHTNGGKYNTSEGSLREILYCLLNLSSSVKLISPETATIIESIPGYAADTDGDATNNSYAMGVQKVGALNNRYTVYKNPYMTENTILMGFRGNQFLESGAVYAPYIPLIMTPLVYDPNTFTPRKGIMTRYAKKMVRPEFYGKVLVADLNVI